VSKGEARREGGGKGGRGGSQKVRKTFINEVLYERGKLETENPSRDGI